MKIFFSQLGIREEFYFNGHPFIKIDFKLGLNLINQSMTSFGPNHLVFICC